ncbi:MAG: hypothetical protein ABI758_06820 [Candidatus Woesebacteria bacterium]
MDNPNEKAVPESVPTTRELLGQDASKNKSVKNILIVLICLFILSVTAALAYFIGKVRPTQNRDEIGTVRPCTLEAKICPDGSSVGRQGPACEFAECPLSASTESATPVFK